MFEEHANKLLIVNIAIAINVSLEQKSHELSIDVAHLMYKLFCFLNW